MDNFVTEIYILTLFRMRVWNWNRQTFHLAFQCVDLSSKDIASILMNRAYMNVRRCYRYGLTLNSDEHQRQNIQRIRTVRLEALWILKHHEDNGIRERAVYRVETSLFHLGICGIKRLRERVGIAIRIYICVLKNGGSIPDMDTS
jgi:hypothetical protein